MFYGFNVQMATVGDIVAVWRRGTLKVGRASYVDRGKGEWMIEFQTVAGPVYWKSQIDGGELVIAFADATPESMAMKVAELQMEYEAAYQASMEADETERCAYDTGEDDTLADAEAAAAEAYKEMAKAAKRLDAAYEAQRFVASGK